MKTTPIKRPDSLPPRMSLGWERGTSREVKEGERGGPKAYSRKSRPRERRLTQRSREMTGPMKMTVTTFLVGLTVLSWSAASRAQGLFGVGSSVAGLSASFGERLGGGGYGVSGYFEIAEAIDETALGDWMGYELAAELGYESFDGQDPYGGEWTMGSLAMDLQIGFPLTLLRIGGGDTGTTMLSASFGVGLSVQHAYGYLRGRLLTALSDAAFVELMFRWTPSAASNDWTERTGLDLWHARASAFFMVDDETTLHLFLELSEGDRTRLAAEDPSALASEPAATTTPFQSVWRLGAGFVF